MWKITTPILLIIFLGPTALGVDRDRRIDQLYHTGWTLKDGVPGEVFALAQTTDGYLWVGTGIGLFRYDGVQFERFEPASGSQLKSNFVSALLALPDGGLWVGFAAGGASFLKDGTVTNYSENDGLPSISVSSFLRDDEGRIWAACNDLFLLEGQRWRKIGPDWNFGSAFGPAMFQDHEGKLWVGGQDKIFSMPKGASEFALAADNLKEVVRFAESPGGTLWMAEYDRCVRPVPFAGNGAGGPEIKVSSRAILFDDQGSLWIATGGNGMRRIAYPERLNGAQIGQFSEAAEIFTHDNGLTADHANCILEDREGNIWVGTKAGLDRFRRSAIIPVQFPSATSGIMLLTGGEGSVWAASISGSGSLMQVRDGLVTRKEQLFVTCGCRYPDGSVLLVALGETEPSFYRSAGGELTKIPTPPIDPSHSQKFFYVDGVTVDLSGRIWISTASGGAFRLENGRWTSLERLGGPSGGVISVFTDAMGRVWFGFFNNRVALLDGDKIRTFSGDDGITGGNVISIQGRGSRVWIASGRPALFDGSRFRPLLADGQAFTGTSGFVATNDNGLWLSENRGIIHVPEGEIQLFQEDPEYHVKCRVFDLLDGLTAGLQKSRPLQNVAEGTDGRLWFSTTGGVVWIDPRRIPTNSIAPPVAINSVTANGRSYTYLDSLKLPARISNLQIVYTALSLAIPERVRFRYRLDGVDNDWQDVGTRRTAFYTNLGPGKYRFQVIACNNDGVWNEVGAALGFSIAPAWYQTIWFRALCAVLALSTLWMLYRLRLRQVSRAMSVRFDERLAERTRIARELHDTLLQTVQGSKLVAEAALEKSVDAPPAVRGALEKLSKWLGQATEEGRAALNSLRGSTIETNDLAADLRSAAEECVSGKSIAVRVSVLGAARDMHPIVRDEIYRIAYEAIRNACGHSRASQVEVEVRYAQDLTLRLIDNGIGIEPSIVTGGREGHFGLQGMRERAERIGSKLTLTSSRDSGTEITLVVPGKTVYRRASAARFGKSKPSSSEEYRV